MMGAVKKPVFRLDLVLGILAVGIHLLLIPFPNWLAHEDLKSEQLLLRP